MTLRNGLFLTGLALFIVLAWDEGRQWWARRRGQSWRSYAEWRDLS